MWCIILVLFSENKPKFDLWSSITSGFLILRLSRLIFTTQCFVYPSFHIHPFFIRPSEEAPRVRSRLRPSVSRCMACGLLQGCERTRVKTRDDGESLILRPDDLQPRVRGGIVSAVSGLRDLNTSY